MKFKFNLFFYISVVLIYFITCQDPALKINLNPPEENAKDTIEALKDIDKLENDLRIGLNEDFDDEKKKIMEIQKARIHDIVHGGFIALKSLIPNPIKASIRKSLRDHINGKGTDKLSADSAKSVRAVATGETVKKINSLRNTINNLSKFKESNVKFYENEKNRNLRFPRINDEALVDSIANMNSRSVDYISRDNLNNLDNLEQNSNSELFNTNFPVMRPL